MFPQQNLPEMFHLLCSFTLRMSIVEAMSLGNMIDEQDLACIIL